MLGFELVILATFLSVESREVTEHYIQWQYLDFDRLKITSIHKVNVDDADNYHTKCGYHVPIRSCGYRILEPKEEYFNWNTHTDLDSDSKYCRKCFRGSNDG